MKTEQQNPAFAGAQPKYRISDVEVFEAGVYPKWGEFSESDLDDMASTYSKDLHEAPIRFDHPEGPAQGYIESLSRIGRKLVATFRDVSEDARRAILNRDYAKRSAGIYLNFKKTGKRYMQHLALLGAQTPAAKGLADISPEQIAAMSEPHSDENGEYVAIFCGEYDRPKPPRLGPPAGEEFGVMVKSDSTESSIGHSHQFDVDAVNNGFTQGPTSYAYELGADNHQHIIKAGVCQAAKDATGTPHTHSISIFATLPGATETANMSEEHDMDPTTVTIPEDELKELRAKAAKFSEQESQVKSLATEVQDLKKGRAEDKAAHFSETMRTRFGIAFEKACASGHKMESQRADELAEFEDLLVAVQDKNVATFSDDNAKPLQRKIENLTKGPVLVQPGKIELGKNGKPTATAANFSDSTEDDTRARSIQRDKRAQEIMKEKGWDADDEEAYGKAAIFAEREMAGEVATV